MLSKPSDVLSAPRGVPARFAVGGAIATATHWGAMAGLVAAGVPALRATALGALLGALVNYALQYRFAFACRRPHWFTAPRFVGVAAIAWCANGAVFWAATSMSGMHAAPAQVLTTAAVAVLTYYLYATEVFDG